MRGWCTRCADYAVIHVVNRMLSVGKSRRVCFPWAVHAECASGSWVACIHVWIRQLNTQAESNEDYWHQIRLKAGQQEESNWVKHETNSSHWVSLFTFVTDMKSPHLLSTVHDLAICTRSAQSSQKEISSRQLRHRFTVLDRLFLADLVSANHIRTMVLSRDQLSFMTASPTSHALMLHFDHNSLLVSRSLVVHPSRRRNQQILSNASIDLSRQNSPSMSSFFECTSSWVGAPVSLASFLFLTLAERLGHDAVHAHFATIAAASHTAHIGATHVLTQVLPACSGRTSDLWCFTGLWYEYPSKRLEHRIFLLPRCVSSCWLQFRQEFLWHGWISSSSDYVDAPCVASLVQVAQDIQHHRSVALPLLPKTTLVLGPMSLFLTLVLLPWHSMAAPRWQVLLCPCTASSALVPLSLFSNEGSCWCWCWPCTSKTFVLLCPLSLTTAACVETFTMLSRSLRDATTKLSQLLDPVTNLHCSFHAFGSRLLPRPVWKDAAATISSLICTLSALGLHLASLLATRADWSWKANRSSNCVLTALVRHALARWLDFQSFNLSLSLLCSATPCAWLCCPSLLTISRIDSGNRTSPWRVRRVGAHANLHLARKSHSI